MGADDPLKVLRDPAATPENRLAAAKELLARRDVAAQTELLSLLTVADSPATGGAPEGGLQAIFLRALAACADAPLEFADPLAALARSRRTPADRRVLAVEALGSIKARAAARALVALAADPDSPELSDPACRALARLSGRSDCGFDAQCWQEWFGAIEFHSEEEWIRQLVRAQSARADSALQQRDQVVSRLVDGFRRRYQQVESVEDRSRQIQDFLDDAIPEVRKLGLQLTLQELANARAPDAAVARATLRYLADPSPEFRRLAAETLGFLGTPDMAESMHQALVFENDPGVAALLLRAAARWPAERVVQTTLRWAEQPEPTRTPALDAAAELLDANLIDEEGRFRLLRVLRADPPQSLSVAGLRTLLALGTDEERAFIVGFLTNPDPSQRRRAADALSRDSRGLDALLDASRDDSSIFNIAAQSVLRSRPTADAFLQVAKLPAPSPEERSRQLLLIADRLPANDLLIVARATPDLELRDRLLARLTSEPLQSVPASALGPEAATARPAIIAGLLLLAQTRIELDRPAAALKAIDAVEPVHRTVAPGLLDSFRTVAYLLLGRVSDAAKLNGPPESWIEGLERSLDESHAGAIVREIDKRWGAKAPRNGGASPNLSSDLSSRFAAAKANMAAFVGPTTETPRP